MIAAMYLTKDLMMDWRLGEQVRRIQHPALRENDGPLTIPEPSSLCYSSLTETWHRIMAGGNGAPAQEQTHNHISAFSIRTHRQRRWVVMKTDVRLDLISISPVKADPTGDYIRHFVPELKGLNGKGPS